jgi:replication-associated recombination protein RarA
LEIEGKFYNYVWKRLAVVACEDIGLANPQASILIHALWEMYDRIKKQSATKSVDDDVLAFAVLYLCRSPKNREVDEFANVVLAQRSIKLARKEIPDFAIDKHTDAGRRARKTIKDFWSEGAKLANEVGGSKYRRRARVLTAGQDFGVEDDPEGALGVSTQ